MNKLVLVLLIVQFSAQLGYSQTMEDPLPYCDDITESFENGIPQCWADNSSYYTEWRLFEYGVDITAVPKPASGTHFQQVTNTITTSPYDDVLYQSSNTSVNYGDFFRFSYFLKSYYSFTEGNSYVDVKLSCDGMEYSMLRVFSVYAIYSWRSASIDIGHFLSTSGWRCTTADTIRVMFHATMYGYDDLIAIDNFELYNEYTSEAPTTTTQVTTQDPFAPIIYDFAESVQNWSLFNKNGALWTRKVLNGSKYAAQLQVENSGFYAGTGLTSSPVLYPYLSQVTMEIHFWSKGSIAVPAELKLFKQVEGSTEEPEEFADLTSFSQFPTPDYSITTLTLPFSSAYQPFRILIKGYTGQAVNNSIAVARIVITGSREDATFPEPDLRDSTSWTRGCSMGSYWDIQEDLSNDTAWKVVATDYYPGMATLESVLLPASKSSQTLLVTFQVRGTTTSPAELTFRKRSASGNLDDTPFLDLRPYGVISYLNWETVEVELPPMSEPFLIVMEGYLSVLKNYIGVKEVVLSTFLEGSDERVKMSLFSL